MVTHSWFTHTKNGLYAWALDRMEGMMHRAYGPMKRRIFKDLRGTVVEVGAGAGANMRYYSPDARIIAVEPNLSTHRRLRQNAAKYGLHLTVRGLKGEAMDLPSASADAVVGTLVLCSVDDPRQVVREVLRILKPGGRYIFFEHVAAVPGTPLRGVQDAINRPWGWLFDGCHLNRNTHEILLNAGFSKMDMDCFMLDIPLAPFMPHVFGEAVR
jgi:SAM-dependent methyltransferase